jgi:DNA-binding GntR family transcriptional regulator
VNKLNPDDARPPYQQVADALRREITERTLQPGDKLPAHHEVVTRFGVALNTVKRAYAQLQNEGLIVSRQGQGSYVRTQRADQVTDPASFDELRELVTSLARRLDAVERQLAGQ